MRLSLPTDVRPWLTWVAAGLAGPLVASAALAQSCPPAPCPPSQAGQPSAGQAAPSQQGQTEQAAQQNQQNQEQNLSSERGPAVGGEMFAQVLGAGGGAQGGIEANGTFTATPHPLILPGLFTASIAESARPTDRLFTDYGYFASFRVVNPVTGTIAAGFNLNYFDFGAEKTFFDQRASVIVRVPLLDASANSSGVPIDGFGDLTAGLKVALLSDCDSGSTLSGGILVSAPTARDEHFTVLFPSSAAGTTPPLTTTVNPTFLQPFAAGLLVMDRLLVQDFFGVIVPTDGRVSTLINNDFSLGYQIYRCDSSDRLLTSVTPTFCAQALIPVNHSGLPPAIPATPIAPPASILSGAFGFPDQLFLTEGVQLGVGERGLISLGVVEPVVGPKAFSIGYTTGFTIFF